MFFFATVEHGNPIWGIFENNLINWFVLVAGLIYLGYRFLPAVFQNRQSSIETALREAAQARAEGLAFLEAQQNKVANAEKEAENILVEAQKVAEQMRVQMEEDTRREMAALSQKIEQQIATERQLAVTQLRQAAARAAIALTEATLPGHLSEAARERLLKQFIEQLEGARK